MTEQGTKFFSYGVPVVTGWVSQDFGIKSANANILEIFDEKGNRITSRQDDLTKELNVNFYLRSGFNAPVAGDVINYYNGVTAPSASGTYTTQKYEVLSVDLAGSSKDYFKYSLNAKASEFLTLV